MSFLPWLREDRPAPDRTLFFQWHRGDVPQRMRSATARGPRYKAVWTSPAVAPQLFDLQKDPGEAQNVAAANPEVVRRLSKAYADWFDDMEQTRGFAPPRIVLGTDHEDPAVLTRQDWRGEKATWTPTGNGHWLVRVDRDVKFDVTLRFRAPGARTTVTYAGGASPVEVTVEADATSVILPALPHTAGDVQISATVATDKPYGP